MKGVHVTRLLDGQVLRVAFADPPRNILTSATLRELSLALGRIDPAGDADRHLKAILLTAEGPNFSLGASVAEHARAEAPAMLACFAGGVRGLLAPSLPIVAAVRGHCLGGAMELVLLAAHVVVNVDARLGQPEIRLGALAPVASALLPRRIGQARAESLLLTGRVVDTHEALRLGLCDDVTTGNPEVQALAWIESGLLAHSASSIRLACRAARAGLVAELDTFLPAIEGLYRDELLATHDGEEGIRAFLEKRAPRWADA